jgi:Ca-activated chloride channel family protein
MNLRSSQIQFLKTQLACFALLFFFGIVTAQKEEVDKKQLKQLKEARAYLSMANEAMGEDKFVDAEVNFRKSIAMDPKEETGKYNLGNAYYNEAKNDEAMRRFGQASAISETKPEKHKAFHNLGNTFMNAKKYQEAVEAYKNALRNNPTDEETRYNLALAKDLLEKNPPEGGDGEDDKEDQKENEDEKKDNENKDSDGNEKESDDGEKKEDEDKGDEKDDKKEGDNKEEEGKPDEPKEEKEAKQQPIPGQLSPQQIKNLLEAMNNEEKKVQDKINAKKQKGAKVKSDKDW